MNTELDQLRHEVNVLKASHHTLRESQLRERFRCRIQMGLAFCGLVGAILVSPGSRAAIAQGYGVTLASLDARLKVVEADNATEDTQIASLQSQINDIQLIAGPQGPPAPRDR